MPHIETLGFMGDFRYNELLELGMPENAADFLNGRDPRRIGGRHYYLRQLKAKVERD